MLVFETDPEFEMSEVELLLQNAQLRDEIEPFMDESVLLVNLDQMSTDNENRYLASMLDWERAPVLPIAQWFEPPLEMPACDELTDEEVTQHLHQAIGRLYDRNIQLYFTDHLSDRQLYCLILRDILPSQEKLVSLKDSAIRWQCIDPATEEETWLRFYATEEDRELWAEHTGLKLPPRERLPFPRKMPQHA